MKKSDKIILVFYIGLGVSLISAYSYFDSLYERPHIDLGIPTDPIRRISFENIVNTRTHEQMFDVLTDVKNYPKVLPKNILSVTILNQSDSVIVAQEEFVEKGIRTTLTAKHSIFPPDKHVIEILEGDARGTIITQNFEKLPDGVKITTDVELELRGILTPVGFLPKSNLQHAVDTAIGEFAQFAKAKYTFSDTELAVDSLYREILSRRADPEGLKFYVNMIEEGKMTINDVRESLLVSEEYQTLQTLKQYDSVKDLDPKTIQTINELYLEVLDRPADDDGLLHYGALLESKQLTSKDIRGILMKSDELKISG